VSGTSGSDHRVDATPPSEPAPRWTLGSVLLLIAVVLTVVGMFYQLLSGLKTPESGLP
jgi:hypothetical protein